MPVTSVHSPPSKNAYSMVPAKSDNRPKSGTSSTPITPSGSIFGATNLSNNTSNSYGRQNSEYGAMPMDSIASKNTVTMSSSPSSGTMNHQVYGKMPNPPPNSATVVTNSPSASSNQYGVIPSNGSTQSANSQNNMTSPPNSNASFHYGKLSGVPGASTPPVKHQQVAPPPTTPVSNSSSASNNYGAIPSSLMKPTNNMSPSVPPRSQSPTPTKFTSPPVSNTVPNSAQNNYAKIPTPMAKAATGPTYASMPPSKTSSTVPNKVPYGKVPPRNGNRSTEVKEDNSLGDSDYGGLPPMPQINTLTGEYGNFLSIQNGIEMDSDYGSLPIETKSTAQDDDYGGLPAISSPNFAVNSKSNQYAKMPDSRVGFQVDEDYQDLPPT